MKKIVLTILLLLIIGALIYVTFIIAAIKLIIGLILLGIAVIALIAAWVTHKVKED
ncbi:hypothetical protein ACG2LH_02190 [Zhouia sp. PK063]|uniref:hypothetical protein n=1 Tax=Zhouia sp. PK063 TaxID=3373602 RepID=UPI00378E5773